MSGQRCGTIPPPVQGEHFPVTGMIRDFGVTPKIAEEGKAAATDRMKEGAVASSRSASSTAM